MNTDQYLVPFNGSFRITDAPTLPPENCAPDKVMKAKLRDLNDDLYELQRKLYAHNRNSVLMIFQAMDAAGKDSTIRMVMRGVNPAGCQVFSFKKPSAEELEHDFLWRSAIRLPERGRIGIFNRSYYEETLVVRVHPEFLGSQNLPLDTDFDEIWEQRYKSIRDHERHLQLNGTRILKFWLNVSKQEQKNRFLERLNNPKKNWKFSEHDIEERSFWDDYMAAYQDTLNATSRDSAPWYAIPADNKPFMRLAIANILVRTLKDLDCRYPDISGRNKEEFQNWKDQLTDEDK